MTSSAQGNTYDDTGKDEVEHKRSRLLRGLQRQLLDAYVNLALRNKTETLVTRAASGTSAGIVLAIWRLASSSSTCWLS